VLLRDRRRSPDTRVLVLLSHHQVYTRTFGYGIHIYSKRFIPVHSFYTHYQCLSPDPIARTLLERSWSSEKDVGPLNTVYAWSPLMVPPTDPKVLRCTKYGGEEGAIFRSGTVNHCSYSAQLKFGIARRKFVDSWVR